VIALDLQGEANEEVKLPSGYVLPLPPPPTTREIEKKRAKTLSFSFQSKMGPPKYAPFRALALAGLFRAHRALRSVLITGALSTDAAMGSTAPFHPEIHDLRGHKGQIDTARSLRRLLEGSAIRESHIHGDERVQDPYSLRCQPQVIGACLDQLRMAAHTLEVEANAVTDNPLVLSDGSVVSGLPWLYQSICVPKPIV
jgi:hypothetical protein